MLSVHTVTKYNTYNDMFMYIIYFIELCLQETPYNILIYDIWSTSNNHLLICMILNRMHPNQWRKINQIEIMSFWCLKTFFLLKNTLRKHTPTNTMHAFKHTTKNAYHHKYPRKSDFMVFCFLSFSFIYRISSLHWDYISKMVTLEARQMHSNVERTIINMCVYLNFVFYLFTSFLLLCSFFLFFWYLNIDFVNC